MSMRTGAIGATDDGQQRRAVKRLILDHSRSLGRAALIASLAALPLTLPVMAQQHGGTLIAAFSADPAGFDPVRGPSGMSHVVIEQVYYVAIHPGYGHPLATTQNFFQGA